MSFLRGLLGYFVTKPGESKTTVQVGKKNAVNIENKTDKSTTKKAVVRSLAPEEKLSLITPDPLRQVAYSVDDNDAASLALACRGFYHETNSVLNERKLAHHVVLAPTKANKATLLKMLEADPELLNTKIKHNKDKAGRVFKNKTIFQLARGAGDDDYCVALKSAFIKLYKGDEKAAIAEMEKQHKEMFVSEEEEKNNEAVCKAHFAEILKPVIAAISSEQFNHGQDDKKRWILSSATVKAIETFRKEYAKIQSIVIEGMHFRYNTLAEAFAAYSQAAACWGYHYNRCALFEDGLLSTILSDLPVNDAQKAAQGLYYLQNEDKPETCNRSLALREGGDNFYEVVRGASRDFVLTGCCVDISFGCVETRRGATGWVAGGFGSRGTLRARGLDFQFLCQTKTSTLQSLCNQFKSEPKSRLVAC